MNNITPRNTFFALVLILVLYTLAGCSRQSTLLVTPSYTPKAISTKSQPATPQVQASQTLTPTSIPSLMPTTTWTPLPTLSAEQARKTIGELLSNNGGCQIPCWWGIIPGKTTWQEAVQFLAPFSTIKQGGSGSFYENGKTHYLTNYGIYYEIPGKTESGHLDIGVQDNIVIGVTADPIGNERNFQLHQILTLFGKPSQVYVSAQPYTQTNELLPAIIVLDYSNFGVLASYEYPLSKVGESLKICPKPVGARLELQDPNIKYAHALSIEEYVSMITGFDPKKLEDVSKMSIETFYKTFQNASTTTCLETPVNLWP